MNKFYFTTNVTDTPIKWQRIDLKKRDNTLAKLLNVTDPAEFKNIRKLAKEADVYGCMDPYHAEIECVNTLMTDYSIDDLIVKCINSADGI